MTQGLPVQIKSKLPAPDAPMPVTLVNLDGSPVEERPIYGTGSAAGDVFAMFDTTNRAAIYWHVIGAGTSCYIIAEGTNDGGATWKALMQGPMDKPGRVWTATAGISNISAFGGAATDGMALCRLRVFSISSGTCTLYARASTIPIPPNMREAGGSISRVVLKAQVLTNQAYGMVRGFALKNTAAAARYVHLYNLASMPTGASTGDIVATYHLAAGEALERTGLRVTFSKGVGVAVTTDMAGATLATDGDIVGSVELAG